MLRKVSNVLFLAAIALSILTFIVVFVLVAVDFNYAMSLNIAAAVAVPGILCGLAFVVLATVQGVRDAVARFRK